VDRDQESEQLQLEFDAKIEELTRTNKRLKRKIFDLYTIFEISRHLNTVLRINDLLDGIILTIIGQMGINGAAIFVRMEKDKKSFALARHRGISLKNDLDIRLSLEGCLINHISKEQNRTYNFAELRTQLPACHEVDILEMCECELAIPMSLKNEICGLLLVTSKIAKTAFFEDDKDFLLILANQLAVSVENARLFESEKVAYDELRKTQEQLIQSERLAALGQLSARVAHEVNNPLGIIKNYLELLAIESGESEKASDFVGIVREEVDRIARIVRQLLDFYRPDEGDVIETNLRTILDETILLVGMQFEKKGIQIVKEFKARKPVAMVSGEQMKQVFLNLLMNSKDFTPEGGTITVSLVRQGKNVLIQFHDTGKGIPDADLDNIFKPFFTTRKGASGTGLGLAVCDSIVKKYSGSISAANHPGGGAEFTIVLPLASKGKSDG